MWLPRVGHPAKEGLRPGVNGGIKACFNTQSGSSSKRGIKTWIIWGACGKFQLTQSGSSSKRGIKTESLRPFPSGGFRPRVGHPAKEGLTAENHASHYTFAQRRDVMHRDFFNQYHVFYRGYRIRRAIHCVSINHYPSCTSTNMMYLVFTIHL